MKNTNKFLSHCRIECICIPLLAILIFHIPVANAAIAGKVQFAWGNVKATTPSGVTRSLVKGEAVNEGDSISTALTSSAQIKMTDGGLVAIRPDTKMKFDKFVFNGKQDGTERGYFTLVKGGFRAVTGLVGRANKHNYKISTPTATIGIRGTDHETYVVPQGAPNAAAGAYSKVNVGETTLTTNKGTVNVLPNQMGFSSGLNELPKLQPINTNLFTVSAAPTKTIKESKQEKKETDEKKAAEKQTAQETKQAAKEENKKESTQEAKQDTAQDTKQSTNPAATTTAETEAATPPQTSGAKAGGTTTTPAPPESPATVAEAAPLRTDTQMDAPANILAVAAVAPVTVQAPVVEPVATPVATAVVEAKPVVTVAMTDTSGNTLDATNQTVTTATDLVATVSAVVEVIAANTNPANPTAPVSIATAVAKVINPVVTDTIASLLNNANVTINTDVQVTDAATLSQLATLQSLIGSAVMTYSTVIDTLANLNSNIGGYVTTGTTVIVSDTITNLTANTPGYSIAGKNVVVTDAASIAQLAGIDTNNGTGSISATTVNDSATNLASNAGGYVTAGKNVTVTDAASIAQLAALDATNTTGTVSATTVTDSIGNLTTNSGGYVAAGKNVTVTDAASIAQLAALDATNTTGIVTASSIIDTVAILNLNAGGYIAAGRNVTVLGAATVAQLTSIDTANGAGTLTYTTLGDTVVNLTTNTGGYVAAGKNVTVTDPASIAELAAIDLTNATSTVTATTVLDTAANLKSNSGNYVVTTTNVTVTNAVSIADLTIIDAAAGAVGYQTILDSTSNVIAGFGGYVVPGINVTLTDAGNIAQLNSIDTANGAGTLTYTVIGDTLANLNLNTGGYVAAGKNITVTDAASIAQLAAFDATNTTGTVTATTVTDSIGNLTTNTGGYVAAGKNVIVNNAASIGQLAALDTTNTTGTVTATAVTDTAANLSTNAGGYVVAGNNVTVTDTANVAQLTNIDGANGAGTLAYTALSDIAATLNGSAYVTAGKNITVTDTASVAQLTNIDGANGAGTLAYTALSDIAANLNGSAYVTAGKNITVTDTANIAQLTNIDGANGAGTLAYTALNDTAATLATSAYVTTGKIVTISDAGSISQLNAIATANGGATLTYSAVNDTAANLFANTGNFVVSGKNITVTDTANVAQLTSIDGANGAGALDYTALNDTAATLATSAYVTTGKIVTVSDAASISQLAAITSANGGAGLNYSALSDTAVNLSTNAGNFVATGKNITVTDTATDAQLTNIDGANGTGSLAYTALADTAATLNGSIYVTTGKNITITNAATLAQLGNIDSANGTGTFTYTTLGDTVANLNANTSGYLVAGKNVAVTDTASLAQLAALDGVNGAGTLSFTTVNNANATHRVLFEPTASGGVHEGYLWADNPVAASSTIYVFDANKNLTQIQGTFYETRDQTALVKAVVNSNIVFNGGTSSDNFAAADGSIYMGRWSGGSMTVTDLAGFNPLAPFTVNANPNSTSTHWLLAQMPAEVSPGVSLVKNLVGTANYTKTAATRPTDTFGNVGTVTAASLIADFTTQKLSTTAQFTFSTSDPVNVSTKNRVFDINQSGITFGANSSSFQTSAPFSAICTGNDCSGFWFAALEGGITGAAGLTAFVDYNLYNTASATPATGTPFIDIVRSIVVFSSATAPSVGINPPVGAYISDFIVPYAVTGGYSFVMPNGANLVPIVNSNSSNITLDASGNVVKSLNVAVSDALRINFPIATANLAWSGGVAAERYQSLDGSIVFGRWQGGTVMVADAAAAQTPFTVNLNQSGSMVGPTSSLWAYVSTPSNNYVQRLLGTSTYIKTNSTIPFDSVGGTGVLNAAFFDADFTNLTISAALNLTMNTGLLATDIFDLTASGVQIFQSGFSSMNSGSTVVTCSVGPCTGNNYGGYINGSFAGNTASDVLMSYGIGQRNQPTSGTPMLNIISGYVAFNTAAAPTAGSNPPVGATSNWESFAHLAVGTTGSWDRGRYNTGLLPQTNTNFVLDGAGNLVTSRHVQYNERATWNLNGGYNNYNDANITYSGGVASDYFQVADGSLTIGRWTGGQMTVTDNNGILAPLVKNLVSTSAYWGLGTSTNPSVVQSLIGTTTFTQVGATQPTDTFGNLGTGLVATLVANFTAMTVDTSVGFTIANQNLLVAANAVSIVPRGNYFDATYETGNAPTVSCTGTCGAGYLGWMTGTFFGAGAGSADVSYKIWPTAPQGSVVSDIIQGVVAFSAGTTPTNGANPAAGNWASYGRGIAGTAGAWQRAGFNNNALVPNTSFVLDGAGNLVKLLNDFYIERYEWNGVPATVDYPDATIAHSGGAANDLFRLADGSLTIGRWTGGQLVITDNTGVQPLLVKNLGSTSMIWGLISPVPGNIASSLIGSASYTMQGSTLPTDSFGNIGSITSTSVTANFTTQTADASVVLNIANKELTATATGVPFNYGAGIDFYASDESGMPPSVSCLGTGCSGSYSGILSGWFAGDSAAGLDLKYRIWPTVAANSLVTDVIQGAIALSATPAPTAGSNPPFGTTSNWESFSHLAVGTTGAWSRGRFNTGSLAQTNTNYILDASGNLVKSLHVQYNERATWNLTGATNNYADAKVTYSGGVASDYFQVADGSLSIGRWTGGQMTITDNNGILNPLVKNLGLTSAYWGLGTSTNPSVVQSLIGTTTFTQVGATLPTNTFGNVGTVPVANLVANFSAMTVDTSVGFSIASQDLLIAATAVSIVPGGNYFDATYETGNAPTVNCAGTGCIGTAPGSYLGWMTGTFYGAGAGNADVSYKIWPTAAPGSVVSDIIQGVVAFSAGTTPTKGANPATGLYQYVVGRVFITSPASVISGNAGNAAPLASSNILLDAAGNVVRVSQMSVNTGMAIGGATSAAPNQQVTFSGGVAQDYFKMADNSITFGRWLGGNLLIDDPVTLARTTVALKANDGVTPTSGIWYMTTPLQSTNYVQSLLATSSYTKVADVRPTDSFGNVGTLNTVTLTANFLAQTVDAATNFTINTSTYDVSATGIPILIDSFLANPTTAIVPTVTCLQGAQACAGTYQGRLAGNFAGNTASSILLQYAAWPTTTTGVPAADTIRGLVAFGTVAPPTLAPSKVVAITMQDANASNWLWNNTFSTLPGNINTATPNPSFSFNWGGASASGESLTLAGATGAVTGSANSAATTGIQFGRYVSITSSTQANGGSFNNLVGWNRTGQWAYGVYGYLDNSSKLSTASNVTITGQFGYVLDGPQAAPMDWNGNKGVLNSLTLSANFVTNKLSTSLQATQGASIWNASSTGVSISSSNPYFNAGGNGAGQVSTVTKGTLGTETCTTCSWYLNGAFTGQNFAGAVVAFGLSDNSTSMNSSGLDGVAALTRTGGLVSGVANPLVSNAVGTVAPTNNVIATAGANTGVNIQTEASVTVNANNVLTNFGTTAITCITCTGQLAPDYANTGIRLGTWDVGSSTSSWTNTGVSGSQFHWITGPAAPQFLVQSLLGTANYTLDGGTAPTSQTQGVSSVSTGVINSSTLALDFNKQAVGLNFSVSSGYHNWVVSTPVGSEAPLGNNNGNGASSFMAATSMTGPGALSVLLDGVDVSSSGYMSKVSGQITGDTLNGALFQYQLAGLTSAPSTPSAIGTKTYTDSIAVFAQSMTMGTNGVSFPTGTTGTFVVQPATTVTLSSTNGTTISSLSTTGGVAMSVATLATTAGVDTYAGFDSVTGEGVEVTIYSGAYSNLFGGLAYSSYGWVRKHPNGQATLTGPFANIYFAGGTVLTPTAAMPHAISATYTGGMQGAAQDSLSNILYVLSGTTSLTANFTNSTIVGSLTGIAATDTSTQLAAGFFNDLTINGTITSAASSFSGSVTAGVAPTASPVAIATGAVTSGVASGHFYGPNANEVSGTWALSSGTISASGAFGAANGTTVNPGLQTVNGTVALVQTSAPVNTATPARLVIETHIDPTNGFQASGDVNNATRVTTLAGAVTGFDLGSNNNNSNLAFSTSKAVSIGTATSVNVGSDAISGFSWGRWSGGNLQYTDRVTNAVTSVANNNLHWIAGPTTTNVVLPVSGTFNYTLVGGTNPTDNLGNTGTLTSASLQANFTAQTVNMGVNANINAISYAATGTNMPIQNGGFSNDSGGTYTATANGTAVQGFAGGIFTGATGTGAGVVYGFTNGATVVNGVAAFSR